MLATVTLAVLFGTASWAAGTHPFFTIDNLSAAANPSRMEDGHYESFVRLDFANNKPPIRTSCYGWADTADLSIADVTEAPCKNEAVRFSLLRVEDTEDGGRVRGYHLNVRYAHLGGVLLGTHWVPRRDIVWAAAAGLQVELYIGDESFIVHNVTDLGGDENDFLN